MQATKLHIPWDRNMDIGTSGTPVYSTQGEWIWHYCIHLLQVRNEFNRTCLSINEEDIKDLTFTSENITPISCWMWKYTFRNTALEMAIGNVRNLQFLVLNGPILLSWKLKINFKKVNLINSNPLVHLYGCSNGAKFSLF